MVAWHRRRLPDTVTLLAEASRRASSGAGARTGLFDIVGAPCLRSSQPHTGLLMARRPTRPFVFIASQD
jgi:hypothetical protein